MYLLTRTQCGSTSTIQEPPTWLWLDSWCCQTTTWSPNLPNWIEWWKNTFSNTTDVTDSSSNTTASDVKEPVSDTAPTVQKETSPPPRSSQSCTDTTTSRYPCRDRRQPDCYHDTYMYTWSEGRKMWWPYVNKEAHLDNSRTLVANL